MELTTEERAMLSGTATWNSPADSSSGRSLPTYHPKKNFPAIAKRVRPERLSNGNMCFFESENRSTLSKTEAEDLVSIAEDIVRQDSINGGYGGSLSLCNGNLCFFESENRSSSQITRDNDNNKNEVVAGDNKLAEYTIHEKHYVQYDASHYKPKGGGCTTWFFRFFQLLANRNGKKSKIVCWKTKPELFR